MPAPSPIAKFAQGNVVTVAFGRGGPPLRPEEAAAQPAVEWWDDQGVWAVTRAGRAVSTHADPLSAVEEAEALWAARPPGGEAQILLFRPL